MTKLLPCPFCGSEATYDTNGQYVWVICKNCGASSRKRFADMKNASGYVTDLWNHRYDLEVDDGK